MPTGDPMCPTCGGYLSSHRYQCCPPQGITGSVSPLISHPDMVTSRLYQQRIELLEQEFLKVDAYARTLEAQVDYLQTISTEQVSQTRVLQAQNARLRDLLGLLNEHR